MGPVRWDTEDTVDSGDLGGSRSLAVDNLVVGAAGTARVLVKNPFSKSGFFDEPRVNPTWDERRKRIGDFLYGDLFHLLLGSLIIVSLVILVVETDANAAGREEPAWSRICNWALIIVYAVEMAFRIFIFHKEFFRHVSNMVDLAAVLGDLIMVVLQFFSTNTPGTVLWIRMLRILRLGRAVRVMILFPELSMMLKSLFGAMKVICWSTVMLIFALLIWSVMAVQLLHDLNQKLAATGAYGDCERCPRAFESTWQALITLTKHLFAGDSWGEVAVPMIEYEPWTFAFFFGALAFLSIAILNFIVAMVVDSALETRNNDVVELKKLKQKTIESSRRRLVSLFTEMDTDGSETISRTELKEGFLNNQEFADIMGSMDITVEDADTVFDILDDDHSGCIDYRDFVDQLHKMRNSDSHTLLVFTHCVMNQVKRALMAESSKQTRVALAAREQLSRTRGTGVATTAPFLSETDEQPQKSESAYTGVLLGDPQKPFMSDAPIKQPLISDMPVKYGERGADPQNDIDEVVRGSSRYFEEDLSRAIQRMSSRIEEMYASQLAALELQATQLSNWGSPGSPAEAGESGPVVDVPSTLAMGHRMSLGKAEKHEDGRTLGSLGSQKAGERIVVDDVTDDVPQVASTSGQKARRRRQFRWDTDNGEHPPEPQFFEALGFEGAGIRDQPAVRPDIPDREPSVESFDTTLVIPHEHVPVLPV